MEKVKFECYIVEVKLGYRWYEFIEDGILLRVVLGYGEEVVIVNGNEYDEWGDIIEDVEFMIKM